ncbi:MAG: hypothetical protein HZB51_31005 [Chloroflexi bacterium]|nr:hypothetical protein [Chloroflexota bacterium]
MKRILFLGLISLLALFSMGCQKMVTGDRYVLRSGETLTGDMMITGGDATLEQGSRVTGSLVVTGGSARANGQVDGDVLVTGGSINFGPSAVVRGVLQKTGGGVQIAPGASVQYSDSRTGIQGRGISNFVTTLAIFPVLIIVAIVVLLGTLRPSRGATPPAPVEQAVSSPSAIPVGKRVGFGSNLVWGIVLISLGILFLLQEMLNVDVWHYAWPILIVAIGLFFFVVMAMSGRHDGRLAIPGSIFTMIGLVCLFQNVFDQFQTWAYAWTLIFPTSVGIGRYIEGTWINHANLRDRGIREVGTGLIMFVLFAAFFELFINLSGFFSRDLGQFAFPALLILAGVLLIFAQFFNRPRHKPAM